MEPQQKKDRDATDSLAPIQLERMSVEEEALLSGKGKGRALLPMLSLAMVAVVGGYGLWQQLEHNHQITMASERVNELDEEGFEAFAKCVFPDVDGTRIRSDDRLRSNFERYSEMFGKTYGKRLRSCARSLYYMDSGLDRQVVPEPLRANHDELRATSGQLLSAVRDYAAYLEAGDGYDFVSAQPKIEAISLGWQAYRDAEDAFEGAVQAAL